MGLLTLENMLIMNMLNKYSHFFCEDNKAQCETLIQSHLNRKFIPSWRKENIPFQVTAVLCWVKSENTEDDSTADLKATSSFQCIHPFFIIWTSFSISPVNLSTHQSRDNQNPALFIACILTYTKLLFFNTTIGTLY